MRKIKPEYSAPALASIMGCSRKAIWERAKAERWAYVECSNRLGGKRYPLDTLPEDVRRSIIAAAFEAPVGFVHDVDVPLERLAALLDDFQSRPEHARAVAVARAMTVDFCRQFLELNGLTSKAGRRAFAELFKQRAVPGLPEEAYDLIRTISRTTLEGWQTEYSRDGVAGLAPRDYLSGRNTRISPEMEIVFRSAIAQTPHIRGSKLVELMRTVFAEEDQCDRATVYRWFKKWKEDNLAEYTLNLNPSDYKNKYQPAYGALVTAPHAGYLWEMDSTPADIMTTDEKRCAIVAAIDVYSRRVVMVVANSSCSQAVAMCIRKGLMTFGKPASIRKDNGKDYSSKHIEGVTMLLNIETPKLPPYKSEAKGVIERFFGTISKDLEEMLPCYTGHSVAERAALRSQKTWAAKVFTRPKGWKRDDPKVAVDVPLTQAEFMTLINRWIEVYENREHTGLTNDRGRELKGLTPLQAFEQSKHKPLVIKDERALDLLLAKVDTRVAGKKGIRYNNGFYHHNDLMPFTGQTVTIKLHPDDAGAIYVFDRKNKFVCIARDEALEGQALSDYIAAQKAERKRLTDRIKGADLLSESQPVNYTVNLLSGKILDATRADRGQEPPAEAPDEMLYFQPEYQSPAVDEARKAYEAYDGTAKPAAPAGEPLRLEPRHVKTIYPNAPAETVDPLYPTGAAARNPIFVFEYWLNQATGPGIKREDVHHLFRLWNDYSQVQKCHPRPDEEQLNIIEPELEQTVEPEEIREEACL